MTISEYFLMFIIYSFVGWSIEVINNIINNKKFVNRGFLIGPYCPIYGFGGICITVFLTRYNDSILVLFVMAMAICGVLEYITSYIMEKFFKARWWDYSNKKYNINGRICLETMIPFGILGCFVIYITNPFLLYIFRNIPNHLINILAIIISIIFFIDNLISFKIISNFRKSTFFEVKKDSTEEITKRVKEVLINSSHLQKRLISAFPTLKINLETLGRAIRNKIDPKN